jgi:hypothetical protein
MRTRRFTMLLLVALASSPASAQTLTKVRLAKSGTTQFVDNACTLQTSTMTVAKGATAVDSLRVEVQDDVNARTKVTEALTVEVLGAEGAKGILPVGDDTVVVHADSAGRFVHRTLAIRLQSNGAPLCVAVVPGPAKDKENPERRAFRVGIGASFDFLNGISASDLYSDVTVFIPALWSGRFGMDAGLYNGRTTVRRDTVSGIRRGYATFVKSGSDSILTVNQTTQRRSDVSYDQLGLYMAPTYKLVDHLFLAVHAEVLKRVVVTTTTLKVDSADTARAVYANVGPKPAPAGTRIPGDTTITRRTTQFESFYGVGPLVRTEIGGVEFRTKAIVGGGAVEGAFQRAYVVQFRISDFDNGFKLGGDIRGPLRFKQPFMSPTVLVYLAKDFDFKRLANFIVGGDDDDKK